MMAVHTARRWMLASGIALCIGVPLLACTGGGTPATDAATDVATPTPTPTPEPAADPAKRLVGTWRMVPPDDELRKLKIMDAAISGKPQKKEKLGTLTAEEQKLYNEWTNKKGPDLQAAKQAIKFAKSCTFDFTDTQVTVKFGDDDTNGPFPYSVVSATDTNTTIKFDPGFGNGMETHSFAWESPTKGVDNITGADGKAFFPLNVNKR
jgi:hypothetical protein